MLENPKILFVIPKFPARTYEGKTMGPDYLAGYLMRELGLPAENIEILELDVLPRKMLAKELKKDYDMVCISYLSFQTDEAMNVAKEVDSVLRKRGARGRERYVPIVVGNHGTAQCEQIVSVYPYVDAWVRGDGFEAVLGIAKSVKEGNFFEKRTELAKGDKKVIDGSFGENTENIDGYFPPYRKHHYPEYDFKIFSKKKTAQMITALGCTGSCVFCFEGMREPSVRARSLKSIREELEEIVKEGYEAVYFDDSTFTYNRKRSVELVALLKEYHEQYGLVWAFNSRVDCLDENLLKRISESGCAYMFCGVESLSPPVIEGMNKVNKWVGQRVYDNYALGSEVPLGSPVLTGKDYVKKTKEIYSAMKNLGMKKSAFLIFGGPSKKEGKTGVETFEEAKETILSAVWNLEPTYISINILRFIPDAAISNSGLFATIRAEPGRIHAGHFSSEWMRERGIGIKRSHPIYSAFEAAGDRYPIPPHMTPEYSYAILKELVSQVNAHYVATGKKITIVVDKEFERYMKEENGQCVLSKFGDMEREQESPRKRWTGWFSKFLTCAAMTLIPVLPIVLTKKIQMSEVPLHKIEAKQTVEAAAPGPTAQVIDIEDYNGMKALTREFMRKNAMSTQLPKRAGNRSARDKMRAS